MRAKSISVGWKIQVSDDTVAKLQVIADSLGGSISPNGVAAMAVFEIAQVPAKDLWLALGAIRQFANKEAALQLTDPKSGLPLIRKQISR